MRHQALRARREEPLSWGFSGVFDPDFVPKDSAGNRLAEQIDDAVTGASYNNMNQLVEQRTGGALVFKGTVSEPANVTIAGRPAVVTPNASQPPSQDFQGAVPVPAGGQVQVTATDPSGNTRTSTYQLATGAPKAFTYDLNGNMTSDGVRTYEWDAENRLVGVKEGGAAVASYTYNSGGLRSGKTVAAGATVYVLEGSAVVEIRRGSGATQRYQGLGLDELLGIRNGQEVTFVTADHLGSIREETGLSGELALRCGYDLWGNVSSGSSGSCDFTGQMNDPETGLYYYRARYYDPSTGRFLSDEPAFAGGFSGYAYVAGDPVSEIDPSGMIRVENKFAKEYPKTAKHLLSIQTRVNMMARSFAAMMKLGRSSSSRVTDVLLAGKDPEVRKGPSANDWNGRTAARRRTPLFIELACEVVDAFEKGVGGSDLLLNSTIEHELVHWLDISAPGPMYPSREVGKEYEIQIYGRDIGREVLQP